MNTITHFLEAARLHFIHLPILFICLLFLGRAIFFTTLEFIRPTRHVSHFTVVINDFIANVSYILLVFPIASYLSRTFPGFHAYPAVIARLPLGVRVLLYFILADFGHYWVHRLLHKGYFWQAHKWHHSPTYMYWLGGVRATLPQQFLVNVPYVLAFPLLALSPWWMLLGITLESAFQNDWMHMNFTWRSNWLEWIIVTPRYHHIHHSADPKHYTANMANLFTVWDRLFGTYVDPDTVTAADISFGIDTQDNPVRLILGI